MFNTLKKLRSNLGSLSARYTARKTANPVVETPEDTPESREAERTELFKEYLSLAVRCKEDIARQTDKIPSAGLILNAAWKRYEADRINNNGVARKSFEQRVLHVAREVTRQELHKLGKTPAKLQAQDDAAQAERVRARAIDFHRRQAKTTADHIKTKTGKEVEVDTILKLSMDLRDQQTANSSHPDYKELDYMINYVGDRLIVRYSPSIAEAATLTLQGTWEDSAQEAARNRNNSRRQRQFDYLLGEAGHIAARINRVTDYNLEGKDLLNKACDLLTDYLGNQRAPEADDYIRALNHIDQHLLDNFHNLGRHHEQNVETPDTHLKPPNIAA